MRGRVIGFSFFILKDCNLNTFLAEFKFVCQASALLLPTPSAPSTIQEGCRYRKVLLHQALMSMNSWMTFFCHILIYQEKNIKMQQGAILVRPQHSRVVTQGIFARSIWTFGTLGALLRFFPWNQQSWPQNAELDVDPQKCNQVPISDADVIWAHMWWSFVSFWVDVGREALQPCVYALECAMRNKDLANFRMRRDWRAAQVPLPLETQCGSADSDLCTSRGRKQLSNVKLCWVV